MKKPIFIIGCHRTGTTLLANILCRHSNIAGIQAKKHYGIHESAFFCNVAERFGDLKDDNNFIHLTETFTCSDYFILSGLDKNLIYKKRPETYHDFFRLIMDSFAESQGTDFWIEKSPQHSLYLDRLLKFYPNAKFLATKRDIIDTVKSDIARKEYRSSSDKKSAITESVCNYVKYYTYIEYFQKKSDSIMMINYEELKRLKESFIREICDFINIDFESKMLELEYKPNTTFKSELERKNALSAVDISLIKTIYFIRNLLPFEYYEMQNHRKRKYLDVKGIAFPEWFYSIQKENIKRGKSGKNVSNKDNELVNNI